MRIFVAGATGAVGQHLVPLLTAAGHHVTGTTRSTAKAASLQAQGATPATGVWSFTEITDAASATAAAVAEGEPGVWRDGFPAWVKG